MPTKATTAYFRDCKELKPPEAQLVEGTGYESRRASKSDVFVMIFALSRDRESAHKIIDRVLSLLLVRYSLVFSGCLSTIYLLFCKKYIFMLCRGSTVPSLAVVRVEGLREWVFGSYRQQRTLLTMLEVIFVSLANHFFYPSIT